MDQCFCYIPYSRGNKIPLIDNITRKAAWCYWQAIISGQTIGRYGYHGIPEHKCGCGGKIVPGFFYYHGVRLPTLIVHMMAHHRDELSSVKADMGLIIGLNDPPDSWDIPAFMFYRDPHMNNLRPKRR